MAGIEVEFIEKPPKAFQSECPICLLVLREPYQATCCGKSFCKECIEGVKANNKPCPTCNEKKFDLFHNKGLQQSLYDFEVYCSQKSKGCEWRGELRELEKHLNSEPTADKSFEGCQFLIMKCPLSHSGCEVKLPRKDAKVHVNDDLLGHVLTLTEMNRSLMTRLQASEEEKKQLSERLAMLEGKIKKLEGAQNVLSHAGQPIGPVEFTLTDFEQLHKKKNYEVYLPPFYTHPHGYKMCLAVWPKGYGNGTGTHLGVTVHLCKGEFDDHLDWPFRGKLTITLVDQERDEDSINEVIRFDGRASERYGQRTRAEQRFNGPGIEDIIALSSLQRRCLKNDCIKLRIKKIQLLSEMGTPWDICM